jgi:hypothetical protein
MAGVVAGSGSVFALFAASATPAFADSSAYELYCPGTPVGNIVLNGVTTSGTITPASPAAGTQFNLTNYQSLVSLPSSIASAAQALGNTAIVGTAGVKVDATGATPASVAAGSISINAPLPSPIPTTGIPLMLPATAGTVGPFTATGGAVSLTVDPAVNLTLTVSGSQLSLVCKPYPNNTAPTGISSAAPPGSAASPVIASTTGTAAPTPTTAPAPTTATTAAPVTSSLATTGPGPHLWLVALVGFIVLYLGSVALALVERPRSLLRRMLRLGRPLAAAAGPMDLVGARPVDMVEAGPVKMVEAGTEPPIVRPAYPRAGGSPGLWFDGWEPQDRRRG